MPDLYAGEPVVVTARVSGLQGDVSIKGCIGRQPWRAVLSLSGSAHGSGVAKLWARDKIDNLMNELFDGGNLEKTREQVITLALTHSLVTEFTSLVAVDSTPARPGEERLTSQNVPVNLPKGWDHEKVFGVPGQAMRTRNTAAQALPQPAPQTSGSIAYAFQPPASSAAGAAYSPALQQLHVALGGGGSTGAGVETRAHSGLWIHGSQIKATQPATDMSVDDEIACGGPLKG